MVVFNWIIAALWIVFLAYWVVSARNMKKIIHRESGWWRYGALVFVVVFFFASQWGFLAQMDIVSKSTLLGAIAVTLCALGIGIAIWARRYLGSNWSPGPSIQEGHELVTSGPYHYVRHPIYTGVILAMLGSMLISGTLWLIFFVFFCALFIFRVKTEDRLMTQQFPLEYPEYKRKTKALIPFVW